MGELPVRTETDLSAARRSARDAWLKATLAPFSKACAIWATDPQVSSMNVRLVLEGWAHVVCLELDPEFAPYKSGGLHAAPLSHMTKRASVHLRQDQKDLVRVVTEVANLFHHNQGAVQSSSPRMARGTLLQCAELLEWMFHDVLRTSPPPDFQGALADLEKQSAAATPMPPAAAPEVRTEIARPFPAWSGPPPARTVDHATAAATPYFRPPPRARRNEHASRWLLAAAAALVLAAALAFVLSRRPPDRDTAVVPAPTTVATTVARTAASVLLDVDAYNAALASGDVDRLLALHVFPTRRFFMGKNFDEPQVRKLYQGWYSGQGSTRKTGFKNCVPRSVSPTGERAVQCDTYVDPPVTADPDLIPACLVFNADGKLLSRTEIRRFPTCPPP